MRAGPLLVGLAAFCYLRLNFGEPAIRWLGDDGMVLGGAERVLRGELPYRDFFELAAPGTFWLYALAFRLGGTDMQTAWALELGLGALLAATIFALAHAAAGPVWGFLAAALSVASSYAGLLYATYHWPAVLLALLAPLPLLGSVSARRACLAGALAGCAGLFMQSHGLCAVLALAGWAVVFAHSRARVAGAVLVGAAVPAVCLAAWALITGVWPAMLDVADFAVASYQSVGRYAYAEDLVDWRGGVQAVLLPGAPLLALAAAWRDFAGPRRRAASLAAASSLGLFGSTLYRPDVAHLVFAIPGTLACVAYLAARTIAWLGQRTYWPVRAAGAGALLVTTYALFGPTEPQSAQQLTRIRTPRGEVLLHEQGRDDVQPMLQLIAERAAPDSPVFFYPYHASLSFLSGRPNPTAFSMWPGYNTPAQTAQAERQLADCAECWVVWDTWFFAPDGPARTVYFPGVDVDTEARANLEAAIERWFVPTDRVGNFLVMRHR